MTVLLLFFVSPASAMMLKPAIMELSADPGTSVSRVLTIGNDSSVAETYAFSIQKFIPQGEHGQQTFLPLTEVAGVPSWTFLPSPSVTVGAHTQKQIPFEIRVPKEARPGGYYEAIFVTRVSADARAGQIPVGTRTGALVLLTVKGQVVEEMFAKELVRLGADRTSRLPVAFSLTLENQGTVHVAPQGELVVRNWFGRVVERLPINPEHGFLLPGSSRQLSVVWQHRASQSSGSFFSEWSEEFANFAFGPYTVSLESVTPALSTPAPRVRVTIWPWRVMLSLVVLLFLIGSFLRLYRIWVIRRATVRF
jgi:hypothetical protein